MDQSLIAWLLEPSEPALRYRTLTELLGCDEQDADVRETRARLLEGRDAQRVLALLSLDGTWEHSAKYYSSMTTAYFLIMLGELVPGGAHTTLHERIWPSVNNFLEEVINNRSDYCQLTLCLSMPVLRSLLMLGYWDDPRIQTWLDRLETNLRVDGARLCRQYDADFVLKKNSIRVCHRANTKALLLYGALCKTPLPAESIHSLGAQKLAQYFLRRNVISGLDEKEYQRHTTNLFPQEVMETPLFLTLHALSVLGYGKCPELSEAWDLMEKKRDAQGRLLLEKVHSRPLLKDSKKGEPSKWATFYLLAAKKHAEG